VADGAVFLDFRVFLVEVGLGGDAAIAGSGFLGHRSSPILDFWGRY
jgi:hypothetical protein